MPKEVVTQTNIMIFSTECNKISLIIIFNTYSESQVLDSLLTNSYMSAGYWAACMCVNIVCEIEIPGYLALIF